MRSPCLEDIPRSKPQIIKFDIIMPVKFLKTNPDFTLLWLASVISIMGDWFNQTALMGLVLEKTGSTISISLLILSSIIPMALLSPIAGPVADKINRRKVILWSNILASGVALLFLTVKEPNQIWMVYLFIIALVGIASFSGPAAQAAIPTLVGKDGILPANALLSAAWGSMLAIGAGLGGIIAGLFGRDICFIVNAVSFLLAAFLISQIKTPLNGPSFHKEQQPPLNIAKDFLEGIHYILKSPVLRVQLLVKSGWGLGAGVILFLSVLPVQIWKSGDMGIGIMYGARGLGALLGPFLAKRVTGQNQNKMYSVIAAALVINGLFYLGFSLAPSLWWGALCIILAHLGGGAAWVLSTVLIQSSTPLNLQGRILSLDMTLITITMTVSTLIAGWAAAIYSPRIVSAAESIIIFIFGLIWWIFARKHAPKCL